MTKEDEQRIKEKLDFFLLENIKIHVELADRTFLNGFVKSELKKNVYLFNDRVLGNVYLFVKSIYDVDKYQEREG